MFIIAPNLKQLPFLGCSDKDEEMFPGCYNHPHRARSCDTCPRLNESQRFNSKRTNRISICIQFLDVGPKKTLPQSAGKNSYTFPQSDVKNTCRYMFHHICMFFFYILYYRLESIIINF